MNSVEPQPEDDRYSYSTRALARLVLSEQMSDVADHAASLVPTVGDGDFRPGEVVEAARGLLNMAQEAMARAVLYERSQHTSWETIGEVLEITRQSAHAKFREDEQEWEQALQEPFYESTGRIRNLRLPEAAFQPTVVGQRLDKWAAKHCNSGDRSVTGGLHELSVLEEMNQVLAALNHLYLDRPALSPIDEDKQARLLDRKANLLDRIATEEGRPQAAHQAAEARARAAELRAQHG